MLAEGFFAYLPWFNLTWILTILLSAILIRRGHWNTATRWASIGLSLLNIGICASILITGPENLFSINALTIPGITQDTAEVLSSLANTGLVALFGLIIVLEGVKIVQTLWRMYKK